MKSCYLLSETVKNMELDYIPLMRYGIGTLRDNQRKRLSLIWIKFAWNKSGGTKALVVWPSSDFRVNAYKFRAFFSQRSLSLSLTCHNVPWCAMRWHDVTRRDTMWHDVTRGDTTWHYVTWRDITWHDVTWHDVTLRDMTWHDATWRDLTGPDVTWCDMTWHDVTRRDMKWRDITRHNAPRRDVRRHDVTWRVNLISLQQEWTLPHVRWLRYCQKTIKTFLGLNLFTDIYTLCSYIDECQKDKNSRGAPKLDGQNNFEIQLTG